MSTCVVKPADFTLSRMTGGFLSKGVICPLITSFVLCCAADYMMPLPT